MRVSPFAYFMICYNMAVNVQITEKSGEVLSNEHNFIIRWLRKTLVATQ